MDIWIDAKERCDVQAFAFSKHLGFPQLFGRNSNCTLLGKIRVNRGELLENGTCFYMYLYS